MAYSDRELLARIVNCEAGGEGDTGMRAVATVIMNRVNVPNGEYQRVGQGLLRNVIFQPGQFDCVATTIHGQPNPQNIFEVNPEPIHFEIADWALEGGKVSEVGECLWYMNPFQPNCPNPFPYNGNGIHHTTINHHCFFRPAPSYADT